MLTVRWGDRLEDLALDMFQAGDGFGDPLRPECVIVGSPVMRGWLKQYFLFEHRGKNRVLANWEFAPLHLFVNDWLARMRGERGEREAPLHPYSRECLRWRIDRLLASGTLSGMEILDRYVGNDPAARDRRRFELAGQLARLLDDYQNYRSQLLLDWEQGRASRLEGAAPEDCRWQKTLWNALKRQDPGSYLAQFLAMESQCREITEPLAAAYRRISLFHLSSMPPPYLHFFETLAETVEVRLYAFNPSREEWFDEATPRQQELRRTNAGPVLMGGIESDGLQDPGNPLLGSLGKGCQSFLAELLDRTDGQVAAIGSDEDAPESLLSRIQERIRRRQPSPAEPLEHPCNDASVELQVCHTPLREVEVLRDHLLCWFQEHPGSHPRDVQVLVSDLDRYAPLIDAVFQFERPEAPDAIPYEIADRPQAGTGPLGLAFQWLLRCCESRLTASELMDLLETGPVRESFGLTAEQVTSLRTLVIESGIRWGADSGHLRRALGSDMPDTATWRRGIDRMLLGYAMGKDPEEPGDPLVETGALGPLLGCDRVEGETAGLAGILGDFFQAVQDIAQRFQIPCPPAAWEERLHGMLDRFFHGTEESFAELALLRRAIRVVVRTARSAGENESLPCCVVALALESQISLPAPFASTTSNKVLFCPLRTMRPTPRPLLYLLGMDEGAFPRCDDRPSFDLMAHSRHRGDRSLRLEDRLAFLEAILCARKRLVISYSGLDPGSASPCAPSPVVDELLHSLDETFRAPDPSGSRRAYRVLLHRLQAFHPGYFSPDSGLVSYSAPDFAAAVALQRRWEKDGERARPPEITDPPSITPLPGTGELPVIDLGQVQDFFLNPARHFLKQTLKLRVEDVGDEGLSDSEVLEPSGLQRYQLRDALLRHLTQGGDSGPMPAVFREKGWLPLGAMGDAWLEDQRMELARFLEASCSEDGTTLRDVLGRAPDPLESSTLFHSPVAELGGRVQTVTTPNGRYQVCVRYAELAPKDRIKGWLGHLLGHSLDRPAFTTLLAGRASGGKTPLRCDCLPPLQQERARTMLLTLLELWHTGTHRLIPFAPACSYAYAAAIFRSGAEPGENEETAIGNAREAWHNERVRGEDENGYLFHAWGTEGPMDDPEFGPMARAVWFPFLEETGRNARTRPETAEEEAP